MFNFLLLLFILVSVCVAIHGLGMVFGLRWLGRLTPREADHCSLPRMFWILIRIIYGLLVLHLLQIIVWALVYQWSGCFADFPTAFYYSASCYSTMGFGDVSPPGNWRILGAVEAVTGILMFGWSTGALFSVVNHLQARLLELSCFGTSPK